MDRTDVESSQRGPEEGVEDPGLALTEDYLRRSVRGNGFAMIASAIEGGISELEIPLCRL